MGNVADRHPLAFDKPTSQVQGEILRKNLFFRGPIGSSPELLEGEERKKERGGEHASNDLERSYVGV